MDLLVYCMDNNRSIFNTYELITGWISTIKLGILNLLQIDKRSFQMCSNKNLMQRYRPTSMKAHKRGGGGQYNLTGCVANFNGNKVQINMEFLYIH